MNIHESAAGMLKDYDESRPGGMFERDDLDLDIAGAYSLQHAVAAMREARGEQIVGYKIGCISDTMQKQLGIEHPVFGHLWDSEIYPSGSTLRWSRFDELAIEGEFAFRLLDDVPSAQWLKKNLDVVSNPQLVIELHNYVFRGPSSKRAVELIANNAIHAGVVLAEHLSEPMAPVGDLELRVMRDSECLGQGKATHLQNGPLDVLIALSEHLERLGKHLLRDQLVLAGSPLPLWKVAPGETITVSCEELGEICCAIED